MELFVALYLLSCRIEVLMAKSVHTVLDRSEVSDWTYLEHWLFEGNTLSKATLYWFLWLKYTSLSFLVGLNILKAFLSRPTYPRLIILDLDKTLNERYHISNVVIEVSRFIVSLLLSQCNFL